MAVEIESSYGDKSAEKTYFIRGVQGKISRPSANRDYTYFLAKVRAVVRPVVCLTSAVATSRALSTQVQEVREHLSSCCVQSALSDLSQTALDIYNRFDNRRRMGVELIVLAMLASRRATWFAVPDKYHSPTFVLEMLVSCRSEIEIPVNS